MSIQILASNIKSFRPCEPCVAWRSHPRPTRQPDFAVDCFVPCNDARSSKTKNENLKHVGSSIFISCKRKMTAFDPTKELQLNQL